ncbi:zinc ion binding [Striga asiatica]|uniref:Zinc ion binding n=1 Tax=Striga asiatica TaxID=4170 RepID=A0A5A7QXH5_STRAF|nr:zinc ion binding [Striga asiatica]
MSSSISNSRISPDCRCGKKTQVWTSWTPANPGRRFLGCEDWEPHAIHHPKKQKSFSIMIAAPYYDENSRREIILLSELTSSSLLALVGLPDPVPKLGGLAAAPKQVSLPFMPEMG